MPGKQAKILQPDQFERLLAHASRTRNGPRDRVIVLLSYKAGLRAMEIARVERQHVTDADGQVGDALRLENRLCKKGSGRVIPMQADLRAAIADLLAAEPADKPSWPLVMSERAWELEPDPVHGRPRAMCPSSIGFWFWRAYRALGLAGCSSHSGRRTFITRAARRISSVGGSLRDVQLLAGHSSIATTQRYIEGDSEAQRRVVGML